MSIPLHGGRLAEVASKMLKVCRVLQWNSTVPETSAPIAVFIRASDNRLVIKLWHAQLRSIGGVTGLRQISSGGSSPAQFPLGSDAYEWAFPIIEDIATSSNVNGSGTIVVRQHNAHAVS